MSSRGAVGVVAVLVVAVTALPASGSTATGVRSVSRTENTAAAQHWTTQQQSAAAPQAGPVVPTVGALFTVDANGLTGHYCTASVVDSPQGDLVLTAAHCVTDNGGYRTDIVFVPGYHDGQDPYGVWTPTRVFVDPRWLSNADQDLDFAFLVVHQQGSTGSVQQVAGGNRLGTNLGFDLPVRVTGYPDGSEEPTTCDTVTRQAARYQLRFDCGYFPDGTSGGPWVTDVDPTTGDGTVIGVIGGYEQGGDTPQVSYSSYFDDDIAHLYDSAIG